MSKEILNLVKKKPKGVRNFAAQEVKVAKLFIDIVNQ
jgi:hypothetical protein